MDDMQAKEVRIDVVLKQKEKAFSETAAMLVLKKIPRRSGGGSPASANPLWVVFCLLSDCLFDDEAPHWFTRRLSRRMAPPYPIFLNYSYNYGMQRCSVSHGSRIKSPP